MSFVLVSDDSDEMVDQWETDSSTIECTNCGESIYEDAEQCPYCQQYVVHSAGFRPTATQRIVIWILIVSLLLPGLWLLLQIL